MNIVESLRGTVTWFRDRQQRGIERHQATVELSLFALYAGIDPAELGVHPDELFPPLPNPITNCIINPKGVFLICDIATLEEARDKLLGLVNPELRTVINCGTLQAATGILAEQLRNRSNLLSNVSKDFTRAAIHRQLYIKGELDRLSPPSQTVTS